MATALNDKYSHLKLKILDPEFKYVLFLNAADLWENVKRIQNRLSDQPYFIFCTSDDNSVILPSSSPIKGTKEEPGWRAFRIIGEMPFGSVQGLIATVSSQLKEKGLGLCVISTFLTDYFFVKEKHLKLTMEALKETGWEFIQ